MKAPLYIVVEEFPYEVGATEYDTIEQARAEYEVAKARAARSHHCHAYLCQVIESSNSEQTRIAESVDQ